MKLRLIVITPSFGLDDLMVITPSFVLDDLMVLNGVSIVFRNISSVVFVEKWYKWNRMPSTIFLYKAIVREISFQNYLDQSNYRFCYSNSIYQFPQRNWCVSLMLVISNSEREISLFTWGKSDIPNFDQNYTRRPSAVCWGHLCWKVF